MAKRTTKKKPSTEVTVITDQTENLPATPESSGAIIDPSKLKKVGKLKVAKSLTFQLIKFPNYAVLCCTFVSEIWLGQKIESTETERKKEPPHLIRAIPYLIEGDEKNPDLSTDGVVRELIVPAVLKSAIERNYPGFHDAKSLKALKLTDAHDHFGELFPEGKVPAYVGRTLLMKSYPKREGKAYRTFDIAEVDIS